jgi:hypothetical protein
MSDTWPYALSVDETKEMQAAIREDVRTRMLSMENMAEIISKIRELPPGPTRDACLTMDRHHLYLFKYGIYNKGLEWVLDLRRRAIAAGLFDQKAPRAEARAAGASA